MTFTTRTPSSRGVASWEGRLLLYSNFKGQFEIDANNHIWIQPAICTNDPPDWCACTVVIFGFFCWEEDCWRLFCYPPSDSHGSCSGSNVQQQKGKLRTKGNNAVSPIKVSPCMNPRRWYSDNPSTKSSLLAHWKLRPVWSDSVGSIMENSATSLAWCQTVEMPADKRRRGQSKSMLGWCETGGLLLQLYGDTTLLLTDIPLCRLRCALGLSFSLSEAGSGWGP